MGTRAPCGPCAITLLLLPLLLLPAAGCRKGAPEEKLAFLSWRHGSPQIHIAGSDGRAKVARLSEGTAFPASPPVWSPDGRYVAHTVTTGGDWAIEVVDLADGGTRTIGKNLRVEGWSPDGAWLLATNVVPVEKLLDGKRQKGERQQLFTIAPDGSGKRSISDGAGWDYAPAVSAGGGIAFLSSRGGQVELRVMNAPGGKSRRIARIPGKLEAPSWSADGTRIALPCGDGSIQRICSVGADGKNAVELTQANWASEPVFSPDGTHLAWVEKDDGGAAQVWLAGPDGSNPKKLTSKGTHQHLAWSKDGKRLAFVADAGGNPEIQVLVVETGKTKTIAAHDGREARPSWQPAVYPPPES